MDSHITYENKQDQQFGQHSNFKCWNKNEKVRFGFQDKKKTNNTETLLEKLIKLRTKRRNQSVQNLVTHHQI